MQRLLVVFCALCGLWLADARAQVTAFSYQGKLTDNGNAANGNFEMQFKLYDVPSGGAPLGNAIVADPVGVAAGVFVVTLDFGSSVFNGNPRYLEIAVRPDGSAAAFSPILPRQPITTSPYAIQTLNARQLGGLEANRYLSSDASGNYLIGTANPLFGKLHVEGGAGNGVYGTSSTGEGVYGTSGSGRGVYGYSTSGIGVYGRSADFEGVRGEASLISHGAVVGLHSGGGIGVFGNSAGTGVQGTSDAGKGVIGTSNTGTGVYGVTSGIGDDSPGVHGVALANGGIGVIGQATVGASVGVYGVSTSTTGFGIYARNLSAGGRAFYAEGAVAQANNVGGVPKAIIYGDSWTPNGDLWRCYNGTTGASTGGCGFTLTRVGTGVARINLGFPIAGRFFFVSAEYDSGFNATGNNVGVNYRVFDSTSIEVFTFEAGNSSTTLDAAFMLVVF